MQHRLPGGETTEVEVHMATYSLFATDQRRLLTGTTNSIKTVVEVASGKENGLYSVWCWCIAFVYGKHCNTIIDIQIQNYKNIKKI